MKSLRVILFFVLFTFLLSCNSILSKLNSGVKDNAVKIASAGRYRVVATSTSKPVYSGNGGVSQFACTCKDVLWIRVQPVSGTGDDNWNNLCVSKDHEQLMEYAALRPGDVLSFEPVDDMLDWECNGDASTFLQIKK